jgi:hypothetical protein
MAKERDPRLTIHVDPEDMNARIFKYSTASRAILGLFRAQQIVEADPGFESAGLAGAQAVHISVKDPGLWLSSSLEAPGVDRQAFVYNELSN